MRPFRAGADGVCGRVGDASLPRGFAGRDAFPMRPLRGACGRVISPERSEHCEAMSLEG